MNPRKPSRIICAFLVTLTCTCLTWSQTEAGTVSGRVTDTSGAVIAGAEIQIFSIDRGTSDTAFTNNLGRYLFPSVRPGQYRLVVRKDGFRQVDLLDLTVNVQSHLEQNFRLEVGAISQSVTVSGGTPLVETESAAVSTIVDRQFADNLPMNGRSFQTLIQLSPGVVLAQSNGNDGGQFSVNGQRASSNYWMVDGVGANIGVSSNAIGGNGIAGALPSFSAQGGTNSLVSVDAMQEFSIQTSSYAPEFGRTPGGQISIVTRSGTNRFHGSVFDYLRNDALDANNWFADRDGLPKPQERQNDFGGTFGGPILKNQTFFFFSYEGLRLRLPEVLETLVPGVLARQNAIAAMQPYLNAFPLPNGADDATTGFAQFNSSFSNSSSLDAYSLRIDHKAASRLNLFGRYDYSPSNVSQRGFSSNALSVVGRSAFTIQTATIGATWLITSTAGNDLRFNYSRTNASGNLKLDNFGSAVPFALPLPSPFTDRDSEFAFQFNTLATAHASLVAGRLQRNLQRQYNLVDTASLQRGSHSLKFGVDFRRLSPLFEPSLYFQDAVFSDVPSAENGEPAFSLVSSSRAGTLLLRNLGLFAQDTWHVLPRLTVTYGLRWDVDFAPSTLSGPRLLSMTGFNLEDLSQLALAPAGTPPFKTTYGNIAPRLGVAYQISQAQDWGTTLRTGFGIFYDLATQEVGNSVQGGTYPFGASVFNVGGTFPLDPVASAPPAITPAELEGDTLFAFDPHLKLPYTLQWNLAIEQGLGREQSLSVSYVGAGGRRLIQTAFMVAPNPSFLFANLFSNAATSGYNALQLRFQRRLSRGLQALASYTFSHSIDDASAGSFGNPANGLVPGASADVNRGPSDFDIRHAYSVGVTYDIPALRVNRITDLVFRGWSLQNIVQGRSSTPVTASDSNFFQLHNASVLIRPDIVPGEPLYLYGSQCSVVFGAPCPGGKGFNPAAFVSPPTDDNGNPLRQGTLGRNSLRGFGLLQWDFAVHRDFHLGEPVRLQFRAEIFNILNHPNFGPPIADINNTAQFGRSTQTLGQSLAGRGEANVGSGSLSPLYQTGGPRSIQLALRLQF